MLNQKNIFKLLTTFTMIGSLTACGPAIHYSYEPPRTSTGMLCITNCSLARNNCEQTEELKLEHCKTRAELAYQLCSKRPNNFCTHEFCYKNLKRCRTQYNECYQNCGGKVTSTERRRNFGNTFLEDTEY